MRVVFFAAALGFAAGMAAQAVPNTLNYQGRLTDSSPAQAPVSATVPMRFSIHDAASGGAQLWTETPPGGVAVSDGIFNVVLGSTNPLAPTIFAGATSVRYLQITLNPGAGQEILAPRQLISTTGYAARAAKANFADGATVAGSATSAGSATTAGSATNFTGSLNGDVTGTQGATKVVRLRGKPMTSTAPAPGQVLQMVSGPWQPSTFVYSELDPEVGTLSTGRVPRWNGSALTSGALYDDGAGKLGVGPTAPAAPLHVASVTPVAVGSVGVGGDPRSLFVQGRYAYVANAAPGTLQVIDVSNPAAPATVGQVATGVDPRAVFVQGRYAYLANLGDSTLQIIDVSRPAAPVAVGSVATEGGARSVYVQGRYAYVANSTANTLEVFDVSRPAAPLSVGSSNTDAEPRSVVVQGRHAYVGSFGASGVSSIQIFDVSRFSAPYPVGSFYTDFNYTGLNALFVQGQHVYHVSQLGWRLGIDCAPTCALPRGGSNTNGGPRGLSVQGRYAYTANLDTNLLEVFDVSNPAAPVSVGSASTGSWPYAVVVQGRYAYLTTLGASTLQIFDLGGGQLQQLETGGIETGTLTARGDARTDSDAEVRGGLAVGASGLASAGPVTSGAWVQVVATGDQTATAFCPSGTRVLFGYSLWMNDQSLGGTKPGYTPCTPGLRSCTVTVPDLTGDDETRVWVLCG